MLLEVKQINSNANNTFQVLKHGEIIYTVTATWLSGLDNDSQKIRMTDLNQQVVFETTYNLIENISESAIPYKYLFTGSQKFDQYKVLDGTGQETGAFYKEATELFGRKLILQYADRMVIGYKVDAGKKEVVCFYENDRQIGQLTKPNYVVDNLDQYMLHFVDGYEDWIAVLSLFTVYFDHIYHGNAGNMRIGVSTSVTYSYSPYNKFYDKDFILRHFGTEEAARVENPKKAMKLAGINGNIGDMVKRTPKWFWIMFAGIWLFVFLIFAIVLMIIFLPILFQ